MKRSSTTLAVIFLFVQSTVFAQDLESGFSIQPYASVAVESWSLLDGGAGSGERFMGLVDFGLDFNLSDRDEGHIGFFAYDGPREVDAFTGDFGVFSNIITKSDIILFTAWLQHSFDDFHIKFGQLATDETFFIAEGGSLFINANFGAIPSVSGNVPAPIFSIGSAGIEFLSDSENGYWQIGAYAGDPGPGDQGDHGVNWKAGGDAGYFLIAEKGWAYSLSENQSGLFKIGAYHHSGQFEHFAQGSSVSGNHAFYAIVDQQATESLSLFARFGINPKSDRSVVERYYDLGFTLTGLFERRPHDQCGIAYSKTEFSNGYRQMLAANGQSVASNEQVVEATYTAELSQNWFIQPSLQWIINPHNASEDAIVSGIRLSTDF